MPEALPAAANAFSRRDLHVTALVGAAHAFSHFCQLLITPLIPLIKSDLDLSYSALGAVMTVIFLVSGLLQTPAGFAVDRFGGKIVLVVGLVAMGVGTLMIALAPSYPWLFLAAAILGVGNSTFHPADMALLNAKITPSRLGYAFSIHSVAGSGGWILSPLFSAAMAAQFGWRVALAAGAVMTLVFVGVLASQRVLAFEGQPKVRAGEGGAVPAKPLLQVLLAPAILVCFLFFFFNSIAYSGFNVFGPTALMGLYGVPLVTAGGVLTAFLIGVTLGTLAGGVAAARSTRHGLISATGCLVGAIFTAVMAADVLPIAAVTVCAAIVGFALGSTTPSRDILVREASPPGARGKVYGFVYSGLDAGSGLAPLALGWFLDHDRPAWVFAMSAALMLACVPCVLGLNRNVRPRAD